LPSGEPMRLVFPVFGSIYGRDGPLRWGLMELVEGVAQLIFPVAVASQKAPEPHVAEPVPWVAGEIDLWREFCGVPWVSFRQRSGVDFSFVGLRDQSAGVWAWVGLHPCSR